jgi:hypothetical protein
VHGQDILALAVFSPLAPDAVLPRVDTLRGFGQVLGEHVGPIPYTAWQKLLDPLLAPGARNYWKSHNFRTLGDEAIDVIASYAGKLPTPQSEIILGLLGGKTNQVPADATAYPHRDVLFVMNVHCRWSDPADDARCMERAREFFAATAPFAAAGGYINFLMQDEGARIRDAYGGNYERLVQIKKRYDPDNLFRFNHNIRPDA